jgi:hypothetical protein
MILAGVGEAWSPRRKVEKSRVRSDWSPTFDGDRSLRRGIQGEAEALSSSLSACTRKVCFVIGFPLISLKMFEVLAIWEWSIVFLLRNSRESRLMRLEWVGRGDAVDVEGEERVCESFSTYLASEG